MKAYLDLLRHTLDHGTFREDRTGTGTYAVFGAQARYSLHEGAFPLLTTKKLHLRSIVHELLWFLKGETNIRYLKENGVSIWDEWADENGDLGPVYGSQWRSWKSADGTTHDQIETVLKSIRENPASRRHIVSAWNVAEVENMALPPCHALFQFFVGGKNGDELSCQLYQRSADLFLGVPFNIASYALLTAMVAQVCDLKPGEFVHTIGDLHLYSNHLDQARLQLSREPRPSPTLNLNPGIKRLEDFTYEDITFSGYDPPSRNQGTDLRMSGNPYRLVAVVAMAANRVIGKDGDLPWHLPEDLKHFKKRTGKGTVVMGRRTWDSIPEKFRPLPGRRNIVISRTAASLKGAEVIGSPESLKKLNLTGEVFLIGGGELYKSLLPECSEICLSFVYDKFEGDTTFPEFENQFDAPEVVFATPEFEVRRYLRKARAD